MTTIKPLIFNVRGEYWVQVRNDEKFYEYRLYNEYWRKRLEGKNFSHIEYCLGYPKKGDMSKRLLRKWKGFKIGHTNHKEFNGQAKVFMVDVSESL